MSEGTTTVDHDEIRAWAEARGGRPSVVRTGKSGGVLRFDFGEKEESFEEISWDEFFEVFEESGLAFLHQDKTADGSESRFSKFVRRTGDQGGTGKKAPARKAPARGTPARKTAAKKAEGAEKPARAPARKTAAKSSTAASRSKAAGPKAAAPKAAARPAAKSGAKAPAKKPAAKTTAAKANG